jgi:hypothetical protein
MITKIKAELIGKKIKVFQAKGVLSHRYSLKLSPQTTLQWNEVKKVITHIGYNSAKRKNSFTIGFSNGMDYVRADFDTILNLIKSRSEILNTLLYQKYNQSPTKKGKLKI